MKSDDTTHALKIISTSLLTKEEVLKELPKCDSCGRGTLEFPLGKCVRCGQEVCENCFCYMSELCRECEEDDRRYDEGDR